jgi:D-alanine-D-alanine ligase
MSKKIVILHNAISSGTIDELDVLAQRDLVREVCKELGYQVSVMECGQDPMDVIKSIWEMDPFAVFNIAEDVWEKGELLYIIPALLNALRIPYTGASVEAMFLTTQKILAKDCMKRAGIPTADYYTLDQIDQLDPALSYILKPIWEEASVGIDDRAVFNVRDKERLDWVRHLSLNHFFVEEYIDGREFNVSMLSDKNGPEILPIAEMVFSDYYKDKPKVLNYKSKWDVDSEEYQASTRAFGTLKNDIVLKEKIKDICFKIWDVFKLKGYARVDLRVDLDGNPYVLEVNGNPCIAPDSGFIAALEEAKYTRKSMIKRILEDVN